MALRVMIDELGPTGAPAGDHPLPKGLLPMRPWQGPEKGAAWTARRAYAYLAAKVIKQAKLAATEAARRDAVANDDWTQTQAAFAADLRARLAEAAALRAVARAEHDAAAAALASVLPAKDPIEVATFAAIWHFLALPPGATEAQQVDHRSRLMAARAQAIASGDRTTLRAIGSAPAVFALGGLGDAQQAAAAARVLDPAAVAAVERLSTDLQLVEVLADTVETLASQVTGATRETVGAVVAELERQERLEFTGSFGDPLPAVRTDPARSGFPVPVEVADPRTFADAA